MKISKIISESIESKFAKIAREMNRKNIKIISLGLGEPNFSTPKKIVEAAYKSLKDGDTRYSDSKGIFELRKKIAEDYKKNKQLNINPDNIIITNGSKMALSLTLTALLRSKDELLLIRPCYPSYLPQVLLAEPSVKIVEINCNKNNYDLDLDKIEKKINQKTKAIILNYPSNPTGKILETNSIKRIFTLQKKYNFWIIIDEVYNKLVFKKNKLKLIANQKIYKHNKLVLINGFSKTYSMTGWRVGYLYCKNNELVQKINKIHQHINTNVPVFIQKACIKAITMDQSFLIKEIKLIEENYQYLKINLNKLLIKHSPMSGGLFCLINISKTKIPSDIFATNLLNNYSIAVTPGFVFGKLWDDHIRICLSIDKKQFKKGIEGFLNLYSKICNKNE